MHPQVAAVAAQKDMQQSTEFCAIGYPPSGKDRHIDANAALTWHEEWRPCLLCLRNHLMQQAVVEPANNMAVVCR